MSVKQSWDARIIQNELFFYRTWKIYHLFGNIQKLRSFMDDTRLLICLHLHTHSQDPAVDLPRTVFRRIPELDLNLAAPDGFASLVGRTRSCPACMTDYQVSIRWRGRWTGWVIDIVSWHQFGACRSPLDWKWTVMTSLHTTDQRRRYHRAGAVRQRWFQEEEAEANGKFVVTELDNFEGLG